MDQKLVQVETEKSWINSVPDTSGNSLLFIFNIDMTHLVDKSGIRFRICPFFIIFAS